MSHNVEWRPLYSHFLFVLSKLKICIVISLLLRPAATTYYYFKMPSFFEECREHYGTDDLYKILSVHKNCSDDDLKKAYKKLSLKVHPDRVGKKDKDLATVKFQILGKIYNILSNYEKRTIYDQTGEVEDNDIPKDRDWYAYWRMLFEPISEEDIERFSQSYKGSSEERKDLRAFYMKYKGDMDKIMENIMCCTIEDEPRFRTMLNDMISKKEVTAYVKFTKEPKAQQLARKKRAQDEAAEVAKHRAESGPSTSLQAQILHQQRDRTKGFDQFMSQLEAKYSARDKEAANKKRRGRVKSNQEEESSESTGSSKSDDDSVQTNGTVQVLTATDLPSEDDSDIDFNASDQESEDDSSASSVSDGDSMASGDLGSQASSVSSQTSTKVALLSKTSKLSHKDSKQLIASREAKKAGETEVNTAKPKRGGDTEINNTARPKKSGDTEINTTRPKKGGDTEINNTGNKQKNKLELTSNGTASVTPGPSKPCDAKLKGTDSSKVAGKRPGDMLPSDGQKKAKHDKGKLSKEKGQRDRPGTSRRPPSPPSPKSAAGGSTCSPM